MKQSIVGYIVIIDREGEPLELCDHPEHPHKILLRGDVATVFKTRKAAQFAIDATKEWIETLRLKFGDEWAESHTYSTWALSPANGKAQEVMTK